MDTERIELPNGQWWEIKTRLTRGDRRRIDEHVQQAAFAYMGRLKTNGVSLEELRQAAGPRDTVAQGLPNPDEDDMMLLVGTIKWSFSNPPGTLDDIRTRYDDDTAIVLDRMKTLYNTRRSEPEEARKNGTGRLLSGQAEMAQPPGT